MPDNQNNPKQIFKKMKQFFLEQEIKKFYIYLDILDQTLKADRQDVSQNIDQLEEALVGLNQHEELKEELINLKVEAEQLKGFSNLLRQSFLTSLYSFMELWLRRECYLDSKRRDKGESYKSIGRGIDGAKKYYSHVIQTGYDFNSQDWLWVTNFKKLRDCIVHRQGSLTGFSDYPIDPTLENFVNQEAGLGLSGVDGKQIFIKREFCLRALEIVHRFMLDLLIKH